VYGYKEIVQLIAAVVSDNPYRTTSAIGDDPPTSLQGILLEYHPNGRLEDVLQSPSPNYPWHRWALEITCAIEALHRNGIAHMDLKPQNIVLSRDMHAILIDISGIGGISPEWLSPEMRSLSADKPLKADIDAQKQNDVWALGRILSAMAHANFTYDTVLNKISLLAMVEVPHRIPLRDAISNLLLPTSGSIESELVPIDFGGVKATIGATA
jgi:serine/threonine protein kinase